jgi:hypothetical protein
VEREPNEVVKILRKEREIRFPLARFFEEGALRGLIDGNLPAQGQLTPLLSCLSICSSGNLQPVPSHCEPVWQVKSDTRKSADWPLRFCRKMKWVLICANVEL